MSSWNENETITNLQDRILDQETTIEELRHDLAQMETQKNFAEVEIDRLEKRLEMMVDSDLGIERACREIARVLRDEIAKSIAQGITVYIEEG